MEIFPQENDNENKLGELFGHLPSELRCQVFKKLTVKERHIAKEVCKHWKELFNNHFELKLEADNGKSFLAHLTNNENQEARKLWIIFKGFVYFGKISPILESPKILDFLNRVTTAEFFERLNINDFARLLKYLKNLEYLTINADSLTVPVEGLQYQKIYDSQKLVKLRGMNLFIVGGGIKYERKVPSPGLCLIQTIAPYIAHNTLRKFRLILLDSTQTGKEGKSLGDLIQHGLIGPYIVGAQVKPEYKELHEIFERNYKTLVEVELNHSRQAGFSLCRKCDKTHSFDFGTLFKLIPPMRREFLDEFSKFTISTYVSGFQSSSMSSETKFDLVENQTNLQHLAVKSITRKNKATISRILKNNYATLIRIGLFFPTSRDRDIEFGANYFDCSMFESCTNLQCLFLEHYCGAYDKEIVPENKKAHLINISKLPPSIKVLKTSFLITFAEPTLEQTAHEWKGLVNLERFQLRRRPGWFQLSNGLETIYQIEPAHLQFFIQMLPAVKTLEFLSKDPNVRNIPQTFEGEMHILTPISTETLDWIDAHEFQGITRSFERKMENRHPFENVITISETFRASLLHAEQETRQNASE